MATIWLGARAFFLLGFLVGSPRTLDEIRELVRKATEPEFLEIFDDLPSAWGSPGIMARSLADAPEGDLAAVLGQLVAAGHAASVTLGGSEMWWARRT